MKYYIIIYMEIQDLPVDLQNKIFYFSAEHPCARIMKQAYETVLNCHDDIFDECLVELSKTEEYQRLSNADQYNLLYNAYVQKVLIYVKSGYTKA